MNTPRHITDSCPFHVGQRVTVKPGKSDWLADWIDREWVIVGIRWDYQHGDRRIDITLASDDEIEHGHGASDGFRPDDLLPVAAPRPTVQELEAILADPVEREVVVLPDGSVGVGARQERLG